MVSPTSRIDSASSFGVFCRSAPSTSAIIRSMKVEPGAEVILTLMKSDSTVVPPVTAERSPPASRMTGADLPVIADSLTDATPSTMSPSPGMTSPASTSTTSPRRRSSAFTPSTTPPRFCGIDIALGASVAARAAQGVGLRLAAPFGDGLGEIRKQHREPEPCGDLAGKHRRSVAGREIANEEHGHHQRHHLGDENDRVLRQRARV